MSIDIFLSKLEDDTKKTIEDLVEDLTNKEDFPDIENANKVKHLSIEALAIAIFIKLIASLIVALLKKTEAWDKLVTLIQKIFRIGKKHSKTSRERNVIIKYQTISVIIDSDSEDDIKKKLEKIKKFI